MRCPICKGTGKVPADAATGAWESGVRNGTGCVACKGTGVCNIVPDAPAGTRPGIADALCGNELLQSERRSLILLLDYGLTFPREATARWRANLQMLDILSPDSAAALLADIRASFETETRKLNVAPSRMDAADKRSFKREWREIERGLIVLNALVEHAAACLRERPGARQANGATR